MDKNDETVNKILADKPIKPTLEEFSLTEPQVRNLNCSKINVKPSQNSI